MNHVVTKQQQKLSSEDKNTVHSHIAEAQKLMQNHSYGHLAGHEQTLRSYINKTVDTGEKPSVEGYIKHLGAVHDKKIEAVKTQKTKDIKTAEKNAQIAHVKANKKAFQNTFNIHHHVQKATNTLARALDKNSASEIGTKIGGKQSGGEGYVGGGLKIVDREGFSKANRERTAILRGKKQ